MATSPTTGGVLFAGQRGRARDIGRVRHNQPRRLPNATPPGARPWRGCWRAPIFERLDYYITIGWGHVPRLLIERYEAAGPLPARAPSLYGTCV